MNRALPMRALRRAVKKGLMHNVEHASLLTYLYSCLLPRCILAYRCTCSFLECCCSRRQRYNLRCSWHTRRYLHYQGYHAWIWRYWQAEHYNSLSFTPGPKPTSFTSLSHRRLLSGLRSNYADCMTRPFLPSISDFWSSFITFCLTPCGSVSWLFANFLAHVSILCLIVSRRCLPNLTKN